MMESFDWTDERIARQMNSLATSIGNRDRIMREMREAIEEQELENKAIAVMLDEGCPND